jgi:hypothetical protein
MCEFDTTDVSDLLYIARTNTMEFCMYFVMKIQNEIATKK